MSDSVGDGAGSIPKPKSSLLPLSQLELGSSVATLEFQPAVGAAPQLEAAIEPQPAVGAKLSVDAVGVAPHPLPVLGVDMVGCELRRGLSTT